MKHDKRTITAMVTGMVIGAVLVSEAAAGIVAEPTWQNIYVDGRQVSMTAYNIAGNNYVRLRVSRWDSTYTGLTVCRSTQMRRIPEPHPCRKSAFSRQM